MVDERNHDGVAPIDPATGRPADGRPVDTRPMDTMDSRPIDSRPHDVDRKTNWLPWILGLLALAILAYFLLRGADSDNADDATIADNDMVMPTDGVDGTADGTVTGPGAGNADGMATYDQAGLRGYFEGSDPVGRSYSLNRVTFDTGSANLSGQAREELTEFAGVVRDFPNARINVAGYADPAGDASSNRRLSAQRATAVKTALTQMGVPADNIRTTVEGETGDSAMRPNRRVQVTIERR